MYQKTTHPPRPQIIWVIRRSRARKISSFFFLSDGGFASETSNRAPPMSLPSNSSIAWHQRNILPCQLSLRLRSHQDFNISGSKLRIKVKMHQFLTYVGVPGIQVQKGKIKLNSVPSFCMMQRQTYETNKEKNSKKNMFGFLQAFS